MSWRDYEDRASRLAAALVAAGLGRDSKVGIYLYNSPEYCETNFASMKFGGIPINVNYRYLDDELRYLLDNADAEAVVFHSSLGDRIARVAGGLPGLKLLVEVDDGPTPDGLAHVDGTVRYDDLLHAHEPLGPRPLPATVTHRILEEVDCALLTDSANLNCVALRRRFSPRCR